MISTHLSEYTRILHDVFGENVRVRLIHKNQDICFNSDNREILYAIQDCLPNDSSVYSECIFGKALCISIKSAPQMPEFSKILKRYKHHYLARLELLDKVFNTIKNIEQRHKKLILSKNNIYTNNFAYNAFYIGLPKYILNKVFSFLAILKCRV